MNAMATGVAIVQKSLEFLKLEDLGFSLIKIVKVYWVRKLQICKC
jgi:hypothetical protein